MEITFLKEGPALIIETKQRLLIVADLHMGIETDLRIHGIHIPSQGEERIKRLMNLIYQNRPDSIIILGDVKHRVPGTSWQEFREIPSLFSAIRKEVKLMVTPGNHDPGIEEFLRQDEILRRDGSLIDGIGFIHGHMKPSLNLAGSLIISGHHHPIISLYDQVGIALRSPCYVLGELDNAIFDKPESNKNKSDVDCNMSSEISTLGSTRILLIPAFNECVGYGIERTFRSPFSPISKAIIKETAECLLPDGTYAGDILGLIQIRDNEHSTCT
jgi:uncharacterized protein